MQKLFMISLCLATWCTSVLSQAKKDSEYYRDTIRLMMPNGVTIDELTCYNKKGDLNALNNITVQIKEFTQRWKVLNTSVLESDKNMHIIFQYNHENNESERYTLSFKEYAPLTQITFPVDTTLALLTKGRHRLEIINYAFRSMVRKTVIQFNTITQLEELTHINFEQLYQTTEALLNNDQNKHHINKPFTSWISVDKNSEPSLQYLQKGPHNTDVIELSFGTNLEHVKGEWNAGFYTRMSVKLGQKTSFKHIFFVGYDWMYCFSSNSKGDINHWVSAGYGHNFPKGEEKDRWYTLSVGYLAKRNGELFEKNTFRVGLEKEISSGISLTPQLYFNDFLEGVYPGIKVNINF